MELIFKIIVVIVGAIFTDKFIAPLLKGFYDPFGAIILLIIYLVLLAYLIGGGIVPWFRARRVTPR